MINTKYDKNYFKVGIFVLIGLGLIIFTLLIFGASKLFQPVFYVETYFDESIQGISEGVPVKYRGLQVGYVQDIAFADEIYNDNEHADSNVQMYNRSIYVRIAITSKLFTRRPRAKTIDLLTEEVKHGLRIKLVAQGLTGTSYLEFDYIKPTIAPPPMILTWQPRDFYVPSTTSTLTRLSENAQYIMNELRDINFKEVFSDFDLLVKTMTKMSVKIEGVLDPVNGSLAVTLRNFKAVSDNLQVVTNQLKLNPSSMVFGSPPPLLNPRKL